MNSTIDRFNHTDHYYLTEGFSFDTPTVADRDAQDSRPDLSISHMAGGIINEPTLEYVKKVCPDIDHEDTEGLQKALKKLQTQRTLRAEVKVVHRCAVLIGEFKSLPSRSKIEFLEAESTNMLVDIDVHGPNSGPNEDWDHPSEIGITHAIHSVMYYVAVYFLVHPLCSETIALASSGPFYRWTCIHRNDAVEYEWLFRSPVDNLENHQRISAFHDSFEDGETAYLLGTSASDEQINLMTHEMARIASQCEGTFPALPIDLNFELIPDSPRRCVTGCMPI